MSFTSYIRYCMRYTILSSYFAEKIKNKKAKKIPNEREMKCCPNTYNVPFLQRYRKKYNYELHTEKKKKIILSREMKIRDSFCFFPASICLRVLQNKRQERDFYSSTRKTRKKNVITWARPFFFACPSSYVPIL